MDIILRPRKIILILVLIFISLTIANVVHLLTVHYFNKDILLFDFDSEGNLPTLFSTLLLIFSSTLLLVIAQLHKSRNSRTFLFWISLSIVFLFLAVDEASSIHERLANMIYTSGIFIGSWLKRYQYWIIPYCILLIILTIVYLKKLSILPPKTRFFFIAAGVIYLSGVLGFEFIEGYYFPELDAENNLIKSVLEMIQELLEMTGCIIFIYALLDYLREEQGEIKIRLSAT